MRRASVLALLALLLGLCAFALAGCGGEDEVAPTAETVAGGTTTAEETTTEETTTEETTTEETTTEETTTEESGGGGGNAQAGEAVFMEQGCGGCHTLAAAGSNGQVGPNLDDAKPSSDLVVERVTNGMGAMPSFKGELSEQQIKDVAAYVSENAGK